MTGHRGPKFPDCDKCPSPSGTFVLTRCGEKQALCFSCWNSIRESVKVLGWISRRGRLQHRS